MKYRYRVELRDTKFRFLAPSNSELENMVPVCLV